MKSPSSRTEVLYGTLGLMILKTLDTLGPLHGYAIARRIEQISGNQLTLNQGSLYPALLKLEEMGCVSTCWGESDTNRRVKFYSISRIGKRQLRAEAQSWDRASGIVARFFALSRELL